MLSCDLLCDSKRVLTFSEANYAGWTCPWIVMCRVDYAFSEVQWRTAALSFLSGVHLMLMRCTVVSCMKKKKRAVSLTPSPGNRLHHGPH